MFKMVAVESYFSARPRQFPCVELLKTLDMLLLMAVAFDGGRRGEVPIHLYLWRPWLNGLV